MTLDTKLDVLEYSVKLHYNSSRRPTAEAVKKICESLDLAREIVADAEKKIPYALTDPRLHQILQQRWEDDSIPDVKAAKEAVQYHFHKEIPEYNSNLAPPGPQEEWEGLFDQECKTINDVIYDILDGLNGLRGYLTLSDLFGQFRWDLYNHFNGQSWDHVQEE